MSIPLHGFLPHPALPGAIILRLPGDAVAVESGVSVSCLVVLVVTSCFGHPHPSATERIPNGFIRGVFRSKEDNESVIKPQTTDIK